MAERPDLEYWVPWLARELDGARIESVKVDKAVVVRVVVRGTFEELVTGARIASVSRRGNFMMFALDRPSPAPPLLQASPVDMAVSAMLAGRFRIVPKDVKAKLPADRALTFHLEDGRRLVYRDDVQMGKVYLYTRGEFASVPGLAKLGIDCMDKKRFTLAAFEKLAKTRRDQSKVFLMDKAALDFFGNAYADEALFEARIHPKAFVRNLSTEQIATLHAAIVKVLVSSRDTIFQRQPPLDEKLRDFLSVRLRAGEACVRCGTRIRKAGVHGHDAFFCPTCQPDERGSAIVDWRKLPPSGGDSG